MGDFSQYSPALIKKKEKKKKKKKEKKKKIKKDLGTCWSSKMLKNQFVYKQKALT